MKYLFSLLLLAAVSRADIPDKIWNVPDATIIETTEHVIGGSGGDAAASLPETPPESPPLQEVPAGKNLDDIPLAKTYPVDSLPAASSQGSMSVASSHRAAPSTATGRLRKPGEEKPSVSHSKEAHAAAEEGPSATPEEQTRHKAPELSVTIDKRQLVAFVHAYSMPILTVLMLLAAVFSLARMVRRRGERRRFSDDILVDTAGAREIFAALLEEFSHLRGELRRRYLQRKQNILFNDDFTHDQKARALLELEREYTEIEFMELPGLLSSDSARFARAREKLAAYPELREMLHDFIESPLCRRRAHSETCTATHPAAGFGRYHSERQKWHYVAGRERLDEKEQSACLLQ